MEPQYGGEEYLKKKKACIPSRLRIGLPVLIAADFGLLLAAHFCLCSSTVIDGNAPVGLVKPHHVSDDTLWSMAGRLVRSHAWFMMFSVIVLSGIVPYIKLLTTLLAVGLVDMGWVSKAQCRFCLGTLEIIGKFGFANVFMILMDFILFNVYTGKHVLFFRLFNVKVNLWVQLHCGVIFLIIGISVSALITQWAAFELRSPVEAEEKPLHDDPATRNLLDSSSDDVYASCTSSQPPFRRRVIAVLAATGSSMLVIVGSTLPIISVDRDGLLAKLARPSTDQHMDVSVMSMVYKMSSNAANLDQEHTLKFFVVCVFILVFMTPLLELALLIASAATSRIDTEVIYWSRLCAGWCNSFDSIEVLLFVAFVRQGEFDDVAQFSIRDECEPVKLLMNNEYFMKMAGIGFARDSRCFVLTSHLQLGFYVMLLAVMLRTIAWRFTYVLDNKQLNPLNKDVDA